MSGLGAAVGLVLGGWLTTDFSWRLIFWINPPLAALVVVGASRRQDRDGGMAAVRVTRSAMEVGRVCACSSSSLASSRGGLVGELSANSCQPEGVPTVVQ